jgi:hypothetical protein
MLPPMDPNTDLQSSQQPSSPSAWPIPSAVRSSPRPGSAVSVGSRLAVPGPTRAGSRPRSEPDLGGKQEEAEGGARPVTATAAGPTPSGWARTTTTEGPTTTTTTATTTATATPPHNTSGGHDESWALGTPEFAARPGGRSTPKMGSLRRSLRRAIPQMPREQTLARQQSEKRYHLTPVQPSPAERRALSMDRRPQQQTQQQQTQQQQTQAVGAGRPSLLLLPGGAQQQQQLSLRSSAPDMAAAYQRRGGLDGLLEEQQPGAEGLAGGGEGRLRAATLSDVGARAAELEDAERQPDAGEEHQERGRAPGAGFAGGVENGEIYQDPRPDERPPGLDDGDGDDDNDTSQQDGGEGQMQVYRQAEDDASEHGGPNGSIEHHRSQYFEQLQHSEHPQHFEQLQDFEQPQDDFDPPQSFDQPQGFSYDPQDGALLDYFDPNDHRPAVLTIDEDDPAADQRSVNTHDWEATIRDELERSWILNLSMHFRDKSHREKFFVTYRDMRDRWRRVTVSIDYRDAPKQSLERELAAAEHQREKSAKIYEAIRDSLDEIDFYDTVTNLKLQTTDGRLHVHVMEDTNEIIRYPLVRQLRHLGCRMIREDQIQFESHMSGFVYRVRHDGRIFIKKEIPGPDTIDEFLYEIHALTRLQSSADVIDFYGIVVDEHAEVVKGLLISYAAGGALVDAIFEHGEDGSRPPLSWERRARWATQIVRGLADVHESGFVQGDLTLSNIVIDEHDDAKIIDINRRGCPLGWEPPEAKPLTDSGQRISMYIGVKSDLYQLGMVLWALATHVDEPETCARPLRLDPADASIPQWYRRVVETCLDPEPRRRLHASQLLAWIKETAAAAAAAVHRRHRQAGDGVDVDDDDDDDEEEREEGDSLVESLLSAGKTPPAPTAPPSVRGGEHRAGSSGAEYDYDDEGEEDEEDERFGGGGGRKRDSGYRFLDPDHHHPRAADMAAFDNAAAIRLRDHFSPEQLSGFDGFVDGQGRSFGRFGGGGGGGSRGSGSSHTSDDDDDDDDGDGDGESGGGGGSRGSSRYRELGWGGRGLDLMAGEGGASSVPLAVDSLGSRLPASDIEGWRSAVSEQRDMLARELGPSFAHGHGPTARWSAPGGTTAGGSLAMASSHGRGGVRSSREVALASPELAPAAEIYPSSSAPPALGLDGGDDDGMPEGHAVLPQLELFEGLDAELERLSGPPLSHGLHYQLGALPELGAPLDYPLQAEFDDSGLGVARNPTHARGFGDYGVDADADVDDDDDGACASSQSASDAQFRLAAGVPQQQQQPRMQFEALDSHQQQQRQQPEQQPSSHSRAPLAAADPSPRSLGALYAPPAASSSATYSDPGGGAGAYYQDDIGIGGYQGTTAAAAAEKRSGDCGQGARLGQGLLLGHRLLYAVRSCGDLAGAAAVGV